MQSIYPNGIQGLSDTLWSGVAGSASKLVGIDFRSVPGTFKAHQKLAKASGETVDELCKYSVLVSDGSTLWFSSESGKIWREVSGNYTLVHTTVPTDGEAKCLGAKQFNDFIVWATENYLHNIAVTDIGKDWSEEVNENFGEFASGDDEYHPMVEQDLKLLIGDNNLMSQLEGGNILKDPTKTMTTQFDPSVKSASVACTVRPSGNDFPRIVASARNTVASGSSISQEITIPNEDDLALVVFVSSVNTSSSTPELPATIDFDGQTVIGQVSTGGGFGGTDRVAISGYGLIDPEVKTANVTANLPGTETNLSIHIIVLSGAITSGTVLTDGSASIQTSNQPSNSIEIDTEGDYKARVMYTVSATSEHSFPSPQTEIFNADNDWGTDSSSIIARTNDLDFIARTGFEVIKPERIQTLIDFDIDVLIGTRRLNKGRVLRWDARSPQWVASDEIDDEGVNAFIRDDNYVYANTGGYGRMYFYNGERLELFKRIPGEWSPTARAKINQDAVGFHLGVPVFGLSSDIGNPTLQGVYGFGSYSVNYPKALSLDYPLPTDEFEGVEIGSIITSGPDLWVSYKTGTDVGVAKLDWLNKYTNAYLETPTLIGPDNRSDFSLINAFNVDYVELPASTDVSIGIKKRYEASFTDLHTNNFTELNQIKSRVTATRIANLIIRIGLTVNDNDSPQVENVSIE
jgi:hypothetical protein